VGKSIQIKSLASGTASIGAGGQVFDPVLFINGSLTITSGTSQWSEGTLQIQGSLIIQNNATFEWQGGNITAPPIGGTPQIVVKHGEMIIEKDASNLHASIVVGGHGESATLITRDMDKNLVLHRGLQIVVQDQGEFQINQTIVNADKGNLKQPTSPTSFATIEIEGGRLVRQGAGSPMLQQAIIVGPFGILEIADNSSLTIDLREPYGMTPGDPAAHGVRVENLGEFVLGANTSFSTDRPVLLAAQASLMTLKQSATADSDILFSGDLWVANGIVQFGNGPAANFVNLHMMNGDVVMAGGKLSMRVDGMVSGRGDAILFDDLSNPLGAFYITGPAVILKVETLRAAPVVGWGHYLISQMANPFQQFGGFQWTGFVPAGGYNKGTEPWQPHPFFLTVVANPNPQPGDNDEEPIG
jgi:hypothetical protein